MVILIWRFGESRKDRQINLRHYRSIYLYNNSISPTHVFFEDNSIVFEATPLKLGHCILL